MDFKNLPNAELIRKLEAGSDIEDMLNSPGWKILSEAMLRTIKGWEKKLRVVDASDTSKIMRLQVLISVCDDILPNIINGLRQDGKVAFEQLNNEGKLNLRLSSPNTGLRHGG